MGRFCDLPSEVVEKIMLLVPADSLVECKSVNKFWYSCISTFINDPKFVAKHLLNTKNESSISFLCFNDPSPHDDHRMITYPLLNIVHVDGNDEGADDDDTIIHDDDDDDDTIIHDNDHVTIINGYDDDVTVIHDDDDDVVTIILEDDDDDGKKDHFRTVTVDLSMPLLDMNRWNKIYHCDGLLLLVNDGIEETITMALCNPALKEFMILPQPKNSVTSKAYHHIGLEHDSRNNKYKCVYIWLGDEEECKVEVYTVGSDSWREINMSQDVMDYIVHTQLCNAVCFGGVCYWYISQPGIDKILSFDMSSEEFRMIDLPDFEHFYAAEDFLVSYSTRLAVWNDSVVMYLAPDFTWGNKLIFFVFTMDKGVAGGWTKYVQIGPLEKYYNNLLPFWKNDEILMEVFVDDTRVYYLASCNIRTGKLRNVFGVDRKLKIYYNSFCLYEKSLVSIRKEI
ncbi:putative F-box protein At3g17500 isoform X2 [Cannabis sativa]|nr:putative F-box protein At3g17500 isoform X2 [Cannabis sativa]